MVIKWIERVQLTVGIIFLVLFFITILIQVLTRLTGISVIWTGEMANYSFIWAVFMGAAVMVNRREHFSFDFLFNKLSGKKRLTLVMINDCILLLFNIAILYYGIQAVQNFWNYTWTSLPIMKMGYVWISLPIMALTMLIYTLGHMTENVKKWMAKEVRE